MARLPRVDRISVEQLKSFPEEERLEKLLPTINGLVDGTGFLNKQLTLGDNLAAKVFTVSVDMPATDPYDWVYVGDTGAPAFQNSWVNADAAVDPVAFRKSPDGIVYVRGRIKDGAAHGIVLELPTAYKPLYYHHFNSYNYDGAQTLGVCRADPDGKIRWFFGSLTEVSLDGVIFNAADRAPDVPDCFPLYQKWDLPSPPTLCWIGAVRDREDNSQLALNPMSLQWEYVVKDGAGAIKINNVTGLQYGRKYAISLVGLVG
jgi:hypothetical protein